MSRGYLPHTLLTEKEVAELTKMSVHTLRSHRHYRKGFPYVKLGTSVRYRMEDIQKYLEMHMVKNN